MKDFNYFVPVLLLSLLMFGPAFARESLHDGPQGPGNTAETKSTRIRFKRGAYSAQAMGQFSRRGEEVYFVLKAEKDQRMIVNILPIADGLATAGAVITPSGDEDGQPGGLVFNSLLKETGDYKIRVTQRPTEFKLPARFMVEVIVLPSYLNDDIVNENSGVPQTSGN